MVFQKDASKKTESLSGYRKMKNLPYQLPRPFLKNTRQVLPDVFEFVKPTEDFDLQVGHKELLTK